MLTSNVCTLCSGHTIITDPESGEIICGNCGMVFFDKNQETRREWRAFNAEDPKDKIRTGMPRSLARHDMGLSTVIGRNNMDAAGQTLDASMCCRMGRLRTWDFRAQDSGSGDRNLRQAFSELFRLKDKLGLSDAIFEKTAYIYRKAHRRGLVRGRTTSGILSAAIYIACRELETPKTLKDILAVSTIT